MCGHAGMVFLNTVEKRKKSTHNVLRTLYAAMLAKTENRGEHATGVAVVHWNGDHYMHKAPERAETYTTKKVFGDLMKEVGESTAIVMGHTRKATKGDPFNNVNNHPFKIGKIIGCHNGTVQNDDTLFKMYGFERTTEVDSEIIFQLINSVTEEKTGIAHADMKLALVDSQLRGWFVIAAVHEDEPHKLHLIRQTQRPLTLAYWKEANVILYNSTRENIEAGINSMKRICRATGTSVPKMTLEWFDEIKEDTYITIDASEYDFIKAVKAVELKIQRKHESSRSKMYDWEKDYWNQEEEKKREQQKGGDVETEKEFIPSDLDYLPSNQENHVDVFCSECTATMMQDEILSSWNNGVREDEQLCQGCYESLLYVATYKEKGSDTV